MEYNADDDEPSIVFVGTTYELYMIFCLEWDVACLVLIGITCVIMSAFVLKRTALVDLVALVVLVTLEVMENIFDYECV
jgi:hypothetical protein